MENLPKLLFFLFICFLTTAIICNVRSWSLELSQPEQACILKTTVVISGMTATFWPGNQPDLFCQPNILLLKTNQN